MASSKLIERKDGSRYYRVQISRGRGTRIYMRWEVPEGKSQKTIKKELDHQIAIWENQAKAGELMTKKEVAAERKRLEDERAKMQTVAEYSVSFLKTKSESEKRSAKTIEGYDDALRLHILPIIGNSKLDDVQPKDITNIMTTVQAGHGYSLSHTVYVLLNEMFSNAYYDEIIPKNPVNKRHAPKRAKDDKEKETQALDISTLDRIRECAKLENLKWQCVINLLIDTGIRRAELCALRWSSINFENGEILINKNIVKARGLDGKYMLRENTPKSGKSRIVYCSDKTLTLLCAYAEALKAIDRRGYIFTQQNNPELPITPHAVTKYITNFGKKYGFENLHPHMLRHSFATVGVLNGVDVKSMSELLGHSSVNITLNIYAHAQQEKTKIASDAVLLALHGHDN